MMEPPTGHGAILCLCLAAVFIQHQLVSASTVYTVGDECYMLAQTTQYNYDDTLNFCAESSFRLPLFNNLSHAETVGQTLSNMYGISFHFWLDYATDATGNITWDNGDPMGVDKANVGANGTCPVLSRDSNEVWGVTTKPCDNKYYFKCQITLPCTDESSPAFIVYDDAEGDTFYLSTYTTYHWASSKHQIQYLDPDFEMGWFESQQQFERFNSYLQNGYMSWFWIAPTATYSDFLWRDGTVVDTRYLWSNFPLSNCGSLGNDFGTWSANYKILGSFCSSSSTTPLHNLFVIRRASTTSSETSMSITNTTTATGSSTTVLTTPMPTNSSTPMSSTPMPTDSSTAMSTNSSTPMSSTPMPTDSSTAMPTNSSTPMSSTPMPTDSSTPMSSTPMPTDSSTAMPTNSSTPMSSTPMPTGSSTAMPTNSSTPMSSTPMPTNSSTPMSSTPMPTDSSTAMPTNISTAMPTNSSITTPMIADTTCPIPDHPSTLTYNVTVTSHSPLIKKVVWECVNTMCTNGTSDGGGIQTCLASNGTWEGGDVPACQYTDSPACSPIAVDCTVENLQCSYVTDGRNVTSCGTVFTHMCGSGFIGAKVNRVEHQCTNGDWISSGNREQIQYCWPIRSYVGCLSFSGSPFPESDVYKWDNASNSFVNQQDTLDVKPSLVVSGFRYSCMWLCFELSTIYYVLAEGDECVCLSSSAMDTLSYTSLDNALCDVPCAADEDFYCGGHNTIGSVYNARPLDGCYMTSSGDASNLVVSLSNSAMTETLCSQHCALRNYEFSAVQRVNCYCLEYREVFEKFLPVNSWECLYQCPGLNTQLCGKGNTYYSLQDNDLPYLPVTCEDLHDLGIREHGFYKLASGVDYCYMSDNSSVCDQGWIGKGSLCYKFIYSNATTYTFEHAQRKCIKENAELASIDVYSVYTFAQSAVHGFTPWNDTLGWWVGSYDKNTHNQFVTSNGQIAHNRRISMTSWLQSYECSMFTTTFKSMEEKSCDTVLGGFICQKHEALPVCVELSVPLTTTQYNVTVHASGMSATYCVQMCLNRMYSPDGEQKKQIALVSNDTCYCVSEKSIEDELKISRSPFLCDLNCPGEPLQMCGSANRTDNGTAVFSVFDVSKDTSLARSCNDLYFSGLDIDGNYTLSLDNTTSTTLNVYCNFTHHSVHCPGGFFYLDDVNTCVMPSLGGGVWPAVFEFCAKYQAFPMIKPPYTNSNPIVALMDSIRSFDTFNALYTGKVDPFRSNNFAWIDGSLNDEILESSMAINGSYFMDHPFQVWHRQYNVTDYGYDAWVWGLVCVKELSYDGLYPTAPKAICTKDTHILSSTRIVQTSHMTLTLCVELCRGQDSALRYAIVQEEECSCAHASGISTPLSATSLKCGEPCPGNQYQYCGNVITREVVVLDKELYTTTAKSCYDLFKQGVRTHGNYVVSPDGTDATTHCIGTDDLPETPQDWLSWEDGHFTYRFLPNESRDASVSATETCWSYGYGGYPVSITSQQEIDFLMQVIKGDSILRSKTEWQIGYVSDGQLGYESWAHPDLFLLYSSGNYYNFLGDKVFCKGTGPCCLTIPPMERLHVDFEESYDSCSQVNPSLICKTTKNFLGCYGSETLYGAPKLRDSEDMSVLLCTEFCQGLLYTHAAVKVSDCYCSNYKPYSVDTYDPMECATKCPGHPDQYCGADDKALWYSLEKVYDTEHAYDCDDILTNGIFHNSTYVTTQATGGVETCARTCEPLETTAILSSLDTVYRSNVTFHCPQGHDVGTAVGWTECVRTGWTDSNDLCTAVHCSDLLVDHATLNTSDTEYNTYVLVTCGHGYHVNSSTDQFVVFCQHTQKWTPEDKQCTKIRCPWSATHLNITSPPLVGLEFDHGTTLNLVCQEDHRFPSGQDVMEVQCGTDTAWSPAPEACLAFCPPIDQSVVMATLSEVADDWSIELSCYNGYALPDSQRQMTSTCTGNQWLPPILNCTRGCVYPTSLQYANVTASSADQIAVTCHQGSLLTSGQLSSDHTCEDGGDWEPPVLDCHPECPTVDPGPLQASLRSVSETVIELECIDPLGFSYGVRERVHVCVNATWLPELESCQKVCDVPQVEKATVISRSADLLEVVCQPGYAFVSSGSSSSLTSVNTTCVGGVWTPSLGDCEKTPCSDLTSIQNSDVSYVTLNDDVTVATAACLTGHEFLDQTTSKSYVCGDDGQWTPSPESCLAICPPLYVTNGQADRYSVSGNLVVSVTCADGYTLGQDAQGHSISHTDFTCQGSGQWTQTDVVCHVEECPDIQFVFADVSYSDFYDSRLANANCDHGFTFWDGSSDKMFVCHEGDWTPQPQDCIAQCFVSDLEDIQHAVVTEVSSTGHPFYHIKCESGYAFEDGTTEMTTGCGMDGDWYNPLRNCIVIYCSSLAWYTHLTLNSTRHVFTDTVSLTCDPGYVFLRTNKSVKVVQCQSDGEWNPTPENCINHNSDKTN